MSQVGRKFQGESDKVAAADLQEKQAVEQWERLGITVIESFKPVTHTISIESVSQ